MFLFFFVVLFFSLFFFFFFFFGGGGGGVAYSFIYLFLTKLVNILESVRSLI